MNENEQVLRFISKFFLKRAIGLKKDLTNWRCDCLPISLKATCHTSSIAEVKEKHRERLNRGSTFPPYHFLLLRS